MNKNIPWIFTSITLYFKLNWICTWILHRCFVDLCKLCNAVHLFARQRESPISSMKELRFCFWI